MTSFTFQRIFIDEEAERDEATQILLRNLSAVPVERIRYKKPLIKRFSAFTDPLAEGKKVLLVTRFYGNLLKPCPGTSNHICCGYHVINAITNCPMDCSYCVLQMYLTNPLVTLYSNWEDMLGEIEDFLSLRPQSLIRLGTGELSDSLALDPIFPLSQVLIPFFADRENGILELKTKSDEVDHLLSLEHRNRTVVSWSLNPPRIIEEEEMDTASLEQRIGAARRCQKKGYLLGFHFDPMIYHEGWEDGYRETITSLFQQIDPRRVAWVSLGGFRYPPQLKAIAKERFPNTRIFLGELFPGKDAKFRYLKDLRVEMYQKMVGWLQQVDPTLFVYLCMESHEIWTQVFGWSPQNSSYLNQMFEERLKKLVF